MVDPSFVTFPDKIIGTGYDLYDNDKYFLTPRNINELKKAINVNADILQSIHTGGVETINGLNGNLDLYLETNILKIKNSSEQKTVFTNVTKSVNNIQSDSICNIILTAANININSFATIPQQSIQSIIENHEGRINQFIEKNITVNSQQPDAAGNILVLAKHIPVSGFTFTDKQSVVHNIDQTTSQAMLEDHEKRIYNTELGGRWWRRRFNSNWYNSCIYWT